MRKSFVFSLLAVLAIPVHAGTIRIAGSDSMADMNRKLGDAFKASHPGVQFEISATDSTTAANTFLANKAEIAALARPMKPAELTQVHDLKAFVVAKDGIVLYIHPSNKVKALPLTTVGDIFAGAVTNWSAVGGADAKINVVAREAGAANREYLTTKALNGRPMKPTTDVKGKDASFEAVASDPHAITFAAAVHDNRVKPLAIVIPDSPAPILPTQEAVSSGVYPLTRNFYYYINSPDPTLLAFVEFVRSAAGQKIVAECGLFKAN